MTPGRWRLYAVVAAALTLSAGAGVASAQTNTITGRVTAQGGQPLPDANVLVVGTNATATTNEDGRYSLKNLRVGANEVQVLRVGYRPMKKLVTVAPGVAATADFEMTASVVQLDEIVTTATGQQRRAELGNAISTLGDVSTKVEQGQIRTMGDLLVAKAPGVVVLPAVMTGGAPTVRIRGLSSISLTNAPIWIVDGVRYEGGTSSLNGQTSFSMLNSLSTDEIDDIEIVKGPSAATLYGTNASNGVVVVTTKKGRAGSAARWTWIAERGILDDRTAYQDMFANWGHAPNSSTAIRCKLPTMVTSGNPSGICISDSLTSYNLMKDPDRTFVKNGKRSLYGLNVSGGTDAVRYFLSGEVDDEIGAIEMPGFEIERFNKAKVDVRPEWLHPEAATRMNFRANVSAAISPKFDVSATSAFARNENRLPPSGSAFEALYYTGMQNYGFKGPGLDKGLMSVDTVPLMDYFQYAPGDVMQRFRPQIVQRTTVGLNANWRPLTWLQSDATIGLDLANRDNSDLCRRGSCAPTATIRQGQVSDAKNNNRTVSAKFASTAAWDLRPGVNLKTTVGGDYVNVENDAANSTGAVLPPGGSTVGQASTRSGDATWPTATKTLGVYVQEQVSLRDRLFITVAARSDQNSAFGTKFQRVFYPKASVSWVASDESFFPSFDWLNSFRVRGAFGASGVQPGRTDALVTYVAGSQNVRGADIPGLAASQTGNAELKPETSTELETGFEMQVLNNRIRLDYTNYLKKTKDALINIDKPPSSAASQLNPLVNIGSTKNWGHEVTLSSQVLDNRRISWDVTLTGSHGSNEVVDLGINQVTGEPRIIGLGTTRQQRAGYPINSRWYRPYSYADANGDGVIQVSEVKVDSVFGYAGYAFPRDIFSVQNGIDLFGRRVRLTALFDYKGGWGLQDGGNNFQCNTGPFACRETSDPTAPLEWQARNVAKSYGTTYPTAGGGSTVYKSDVGYIQNGQFWKFREFSASYLLPGVVTQRIRAQNGSTVVFAMRNIHTWSSYTGLDPEEHDGPSDVQSNFQSAPPKTYLTLRLNLKY